VYSSERWVGRSADWTTLGVENQRTATRWGVVCGIVRNTLALFIMKVHDLLAVAGPTDAALPVRLG
jgi:hypothetical protein